MIELAGIQKVYHSERGTVTALDGVTLRVGEGEFVAIMGPSGCGKSTLLNIIGCLDRQSAGSYRLDGQDTGAFTTAKRAHARSHVFGFVFQAFYLIPEMNVLENVMLPLRYDGTPKKRRAEKAGLALESLGIAALQKERPAKLSGGEQQRVAIARALVTDTRVLLCDEPTGNLDSNTGAELMALLRELHETHGKTIVLVTHDVKVAGHGSRIVEMEDGKITADLAMADAAFTERR